MEIMKRLVREEEGQGLVEYVMILAVVVAIGVAVSTSGLGKLISDKITALVTTATS